MNGDFALFLGCTIPLKNVEFERASRLVLEDLGFRLHEMEGAACCPNPVAIQSLNSDTWMALAARNISIAEGMGMDIITLCAGCFETLRTVNHVLKHNDKYKQRIQEILSGSGHEYKGSITVHHLASVLSDKEVLGKAKKLTRTPLDLAVAPHYGCHLIRPSMHMQFDDPERPESIDSVLKAIGLSPLEFASKVECCGYCARLHENIGQELSERKIKELQLLNAECLVAVCPACANQYSNAQRKHNRASPQEQKMDLPVLYLTEIIALAFGYSAEELGLKSKMIKPTRLLEKMSA